jgi:hypothetical protein
MAYGKQSSFKGRNISAKYTSKEGTTFLEVPYFLLSEKKGDKYPALTPEELKALTGAETHPTEISGDLVEITTREGEYEGQPVRSFKLVLEDGDTRNYVEFGLGSIVGRGVANTVLNLKGADNVRIGSYSSFNKAKGKAFPQVSVRQGDSEETVKWKYDPKAENSPLPKAREFQGKGGKVELDYTEQEVFLFNALNEFAKTVGDLPRKAAAPKKVEAKKAAQSEVSDTGDEPPF